MQVCTVGAAVSLTGPNILFRVKDHAFAGSVAFVPSEQQFRLCTREARCQTTSLRMISLPRSLLHEFASACHVAMQRLDTNSDLIQCMLVGKPFGCNVVVTQIVSCVVHAAGTVLGRFNYTPAFVYACYKG